MLNDFRLYDHCLSPLEVKEISQGLILHYKLDGFNGGNSFNMGVNSKDLNAYENAGKTNINFGTYGSPATVRRTDGFLETKATANYKGTAIYANSLNLEVGKIYTYSVMAYHTGMTQGKLSFYPMIYNSAGTRDTSTSFPIYVSTNTD